MGGKEGTKTNHVLRCFLFEFEEAELGCSVHPLRRAGLSLLHKYLITFCLRHAMLLFVLVLYIAFAFPVLCLVLQSRLIDCC